MDEEKRWDTAAEDYQRVFALGLNEYNAGLLRFWHEQGMLFPGCRVLDIGCGVGKYGTCLAELGYDVTLTDISGEMLRRAAANMERFRTPWAVYRCDFNEADGEEDVFSKGFDLTISTMSPAVHDTATVRKMSGMTRGWCFLARFRSWEQPLRDELMRRMGVEPRQRMGDLGEDVEAMIRSVAEAGFDPLVRCVDYNWSDRRTPEQMADYLCRRVFSEEEEQDVLRAKALACAEEMADEDGFLEDAVYTGVAWIYWKTGERNDRGTLSESR